MVAIKSDEPVMRLIASAGWTRKRFEDIFGFSRNRLTWQGQARFNHVAPSIVESLRAMLADSGQELETKCAELFGTSDLQEAYTAYRLARRQQAKLPLKFARPMTGETPIERLVRLVGGVSTLSNLLCVNEFTLRRYWVGDTQSLPTDVRQALTDTGWRYAGSFIAACDRTDARRNPAAVRPGPRAEKE